MSGQLGGFATLAVEAWRDGLRRRFAFVVAFVALVGLLGAESCTDFGLGDISMNQQELDPQLVAGFVAPLLYAFQAFVFVAIAGVLASDHLASPLAEGSAALWLARPVARGSYAGARLAGALGVAAVAGVLMLGGTGALLVARHGLAAGPAIWGAIAALAGALCVSALAMAASLWIGRAAVLLLVVLGIPFVVFANAAMFAGALFELEVGGLTASVTRFAPPLGLAVIAAVAPWNPHVELGDELAPLWRLSAWALGSVALLVLAFRRTEIR